MEIIKCKVWDKRKQKMLYPKKDFNMIPVTPMPIGLNNGGMSIEYEILLSSGKYDKNGNDITEKDLIVCNDYPFYLNGDLNYIGEVFYWEEETCWYVELHAVSDRVSGRAIGGPLYDYKKCSVIGNKLENPELLK